MPKNTMKNGLTLTLTSIYFIFKYVFTCYLC